VEKLLHENFLPHSTQNMVVAYLNERKSLVASFHSFIHTLLDLRRGKVLD